ncbi:hypothetical protein OQA88_9166 [Cercophora sp. LCS_1]
MRRTTLVLDKIAQDNIGKHPDGIFIASFWGWKAYVITSLPTMTQIQVKSKSRDYRLTTTITLASIGGLSRPRLGSLLGRDHGLCFGADFHNVNARELALGTPTNRIAKSFSIAWSSCLDSMRAAVHHDSDIDLWTWLFRMTVISTSRAIFGPRSPFTTDPNLWEDLAVYNDTYHPVKNMLSFAVPWRGIKEQHKLTNAFLELLDQGGFDQSCSLAQSRQRCFAKFCLDEHGQAGINITTTLGQSKPAAAAFACLSFIFRNSGLIDRLRGEIDAHGIEFHPSRAVDECPLLLSCLHETLRLGTLGAMVGWITDDHVFEVKPSGRRYLLRGGRALWAAGGVAQRSEELFPDPGMFVPERFLGVRYPETQVPGFRAFAGGDVICLGRHYFRSVTMEMLASLLTEFEFEETQRGPLCVPDVTSFAVGDGVVRPRGNTIVGIRARRRETEQG